MKRFTVTSNMSKEELLDLRKQAGGKPKKFVLRIEGEKYPESERPVTDLEFLQGINGEVIFK